MSAKENSELFRTSILSKLTRSKKKPANNFPSIPRFEIIKKLGEGGMASVFLARQESTGREVAIKIMSKHLESQSRWSDRFLDEARRLAQLSHSNIVPVFDWGTHDDIGFIVMEFMKGGDLTNRINKTRLSIKEIIEITQQIATGLDFAGSKGFIHRDIKPDNILFREDGSACILDFGIAKESESNTTISSQGIPIGTGAYLSPEQAQPSGKQIDSRSDLYSLGVVLYQMLTEKRPFEYRHNEPSQAFLLYIFAHVNSPPPPLPNKLAMFQPIMNKLLAKNADERFDRGKSLKKALSNLEASLPESLLALAVEDIPISEPNTQFAGANETAATIALSVSDEATLFSNVASSESSQLATEIVQTNELQNSGENQNPFAENSVENIDPDGSPGLSRIKSKTEQPLTPAIAPQPNPLAETYFEPNPIQHTVTYSQPTTKTATRIAFSLAIILVGILMGYGIVQFKNNPQWLSSLLNNPANENQESKPAQAIAIQNEIADSTSDSATDSLDTDKSPIKAPIESASPKEQIDPKQEQITQLTTQIEPLKDADVDELNKRKNLIRLYKQLQNLDPENKTASKALSALLESQIAHSENAIKSENFDTAQSSNQLVQLLSSDAAKKLDGTYNKAVTKQKERKQKEKELNALEKRIVSNLGQPSNNSNAFRKTLIDTSILLKKANKLGMPTDQQKYYSDVTTTRFVKITNNTLSNKHSTIAKHWINDAPKASIPPSDIDALKKKLTSLEKELAALKKPNPPEVEVTPEKPETKPEIVNKPASPVKNTKEKAVATEFPQIKKSKSQDNSTNSFSENTKFLEKNRNEDIIAETETAITEEDPVEEPVIEKQKKEIKVRTFGVF